MPIDPGEAALEPRTQQFVDSLAGAPPIYTLSPADARSYWPGYSRYRSANRPHTSRMSHSRSALLDLFRFGSFARPALPKSCRWWSIFTAAAGSWVIETR